MITVISCTNRPANNSLKVARHISTLLTDQNVENQVLDFQDLPENVAFNEVFGRRSPAFQRLVDKFIVPAEKLVLVIPEYNGSFPGILKVFFDAVPPADCRGKKVALVGVASGRSGNLRGMEHFTGIAHYLQMEVYHRKCQLAKIESLLGGDGSLLDAESKEFLAFQAEGFLAF